MREIKFRAWIEKYALMARVNLFNIDYQEIVAMIDGEDYEFNCGEYELMQYTGLKDKNGKEIYEGDIIKREWISINGVFCVYWLPVFRDETGAWRIKYPNKALDSIYQLRKKIEVIGNIYENPELLEDKP